MCLSSGLRAVDKNINPNPAGGGHISPPVFQKIISLEPNVGLTSDQAVNSSFSVVQRSIKKIDQFGPSKDPGGPFFVDGPLELALSDPFWGPFWGP